MKRPKRQENHVDREISEAQRMLCTNNASEKENRNQLLPLPVHVPVPPDSGVQDFESSAAFILRKWASTFVRPWFPFRSKCCPLILHVRGSMFFLSLPTHRQIRSASLHTTSPSVSGFRQKQDWCPQWTCQRHLLCLVVPPPEHRP